MCLDEGKAEAQLAGQLGDLGHCMPAAGHRQAGWLEGCLAHVTAGHSPGAGHRLAGGLFGVGHCRSPTWCRALAQAGWLAGWNAVPNGSLQVTNLVWHRSPTWCRAQTCWLAWHVIACHKPWCNTQPGWLCNTQPGWMFGMCHCRSPTWCMAQAGWLALCFEQVIAGRPPGVGTGGLDGCLTWVTAAHQAVAGHMLEGWRAVCQWSLKVTHLVQGTGTG